MQHWQQRERQLPGKQRLRQRALLWGLQTQWPAELAFQHLYRRRRKLVPLRKGHRLRLTRKGRTRLPVGDRQRAVLQMAQSKPEMVPKDRKIHRFPRMPITGLKTNDQAEDDAPAFRMTVRNTLRLPKCE